MKIPTLILMTILLQNIIISSTVAAAPLHKYGSVKKYNASPSVQQTNRDQLINKAILQYNGASKEDQRQLIKAYGDAEVKAAQAGKYNDADFYRSILKRIKQN